MQKWQDVVISQFGGVVKSASVTVKNAGLQTSPTIYSDNGTSTIANSTVTADPLGRYSFYVAAGRYDLNISGAGITAYTESDVLIFDPNDVSDGAAYVRTIQSGTGAVAETTQTALRRWVWLDQYGADPTGVASSATAWTNAEAALGANGGTIYVGYGTYLGDYTPTKSNITIEGRGPEATILKGQFTVAAGISRGTLRNLSINGYATKAYCIGIVTSGAGSAGLWKYENVIMYGATTDTVLLGNDASAPDVASHIFINCGAYGGSFGSAVPSNSQIKVAGSNTLLIKWIGGFIGGGAMSNNIKISGGQLACHDVQSANATDYHVLATGGQFMSYGEHSEGTGGFFHSTSADNQGVNSAQHLIVGAQLSNTGATTSNREIYMEGARQLSLVSCFFSQNVELNTATGRICVHWNTFSAGKGYVNSTSGGQIIGGGATGGLLLANNIPLSAMSNAAASYVSGNNSNAYAQDVFGYQELTVLSASDVNGPNRQGLFFEVRDIDAGGFAVVGYEHNATPSIIYQNGAHYTTGAPGAGQIQIKSRGIGLGVSFRADAGANNNRLAITWIGCN